LEFTKDEAKRALQQIEQSIAKAVFSHVKHTLFALEENPARISLDFPLIVLVGITERRRNILTCTQTSKASKVIWTQAYKKLLLISFKQVISQVELISKNKLATYAKHAKLTQVIIESTICHDYKVLNIIQ
jgi:hypothetical protein